MQMMNAEAFSSHYNENSDAKILLDVRSSGELDDFGRFAFAIHIPFIQVAAKADDLDRNASVYIFCKIGARAKLAAELLEDLGFEPDMIFVLDEVGFSEIEHLIKKNGS